jgi:hypothetical protein
MLVGVDCECERLRELLKAADGRYQRRIAEKKSSDLEPC